MTTITEKLKGTGVALVTPFHEQLDLDMRGFASLLAHTGPHVDYFVVHGTTAESPTLSKQEVASLLSHTKRHNIWEKPIVLGIGGNYTAQVVQTIKETDFSGIDAILSASPAYNKPSQEGIFQHYTQIANASPVPVILYNVPGRTASNMTAATTIRLSAHHNIIGIKEASGDLIQCMSIAKHTPDDFLLISGDDLLTVPIISIGGHGAISVMANAFPEAFSTYTRAALQGDYKRAQTLMLQQIETNQLLFAEGNPVGVKRVLELLGVCGAQVRLPLVKGSEALKEQLALAMKDIQL